MGSWGENTHGHSGREQDSSVLQVGCIPEEPTQLETNADNE